MEKRTKDELRVLRGIIAKTVPIEQAFLFGSQVTGTTHDDSNTSLKCILFQSE